MADHSGSTAGWEHPGEGGRDSARGGDYSLYAKDNFEFERQFQLIRGKSQVQKKKK